VRSRFRCLAAIIVGSLLLVTSSAMARPLIVWEDARSFSTSQFDIYGYDPTSGREFRICADLPGDQVDPAVSGSVVVWTDWRNDPGDGSDADIYAARLDGDEPSAVTGFALGPAEFTICTAPGWQYLPAVSGDIVVWQDSRSFTDTGWDIYGYDIAARREFPICTAPGDQVAPAISGNIVVWTDERNAALTGSDICGFDLRAGREFPVCLQLGHQSRAAVDDTLIVWEDWRDFHKTGPDIYGYDLLAEEEFAVCTKMASQRWPSISGTIVAWEDWRNDPADNSNSDIYCCDIATGLERPVSTALGHQYCPVVSGRTVVWEDQRFYSVTGYDVYACDLDSGQEFVVCAAEGSQGCIAQKPSSYWELWVNKSGGVNLGLEATVANLGITAAKIGVTASEKKGLRYQLDHLYAGEDPDYPHEHDSLSITRQRGAGLSFGGDLLAAELGIIKGSIAAGEAGLKVMETRTYVFPDPFGDGDDSLHQDHVITLMTLCDFAELGGAIDPLTSSLIQTLGGRLANAAEFRRGLGSEFTGYAQGGFLNLELGFDATTDSPGLSVSGSLPDSVIGDGISLSLSHEYELDPVAHEFAAEVGVSRQCGVPLIIGSSQLGSLTYGLTLDESAALQSYFIGSTYQSSWGANLFYEDQHLWSRRYDIPPETAAANALPLAATALAGLFLDVPVFFCYGVADLSGAVDDAHGILCDYSEDNPGVPVASYTWEQSTARALEVGFSVSISVGLGFEVGYSVGTVLGRDWTTFEGVIQDGRHEPTTIYYLPARTPTYEGVDGFAAMMGTIAGRSLASIWTGFLGGLQQTTATVASGLTDALTLAGTLVNDPREGVSILHADATGFGQQIIVTAYSAVAELGRAIFAPSSSPAMAASVPYRSSRVRTLGLRAASAEPPRLTLVSRTHLITVENEAGEPITPFPVDAITFETTATAQQLADYGFHRSHLPAVRLYHWLPDTAVWGEIPSTQVPGDASVTITAGIPEAGQYALAIVETTTPPAAPELVNMTPLSDHLYPDTTVDLVAVFRSDAGMDPGSAAVEIDGQTADFDAALSQAGLYLALSAETALQPGPHRVTFWADDLAAQPGFGSALFYIQRRHTFPDVPDDRWAWREIESARLARVVAGYDDGLYHPELAVTRDQMAVYIARALAGGDEHVPEWTGDPSFTDVAEDQWAFDHIEYAVDQDVVKGYPEGDYKPDLEVTRDQMAVYIARAIAAPTGPASLDEYTPPDTPTFADVPEGSWGRECIEYCVENRIVKGYDDGLYHPADRVTRDQMAVYICRAFALPM